MATTKIWKVRRAPTKFLIVTGLAICLGFIGICYVVLMEMARRDWKAAEIAASNIVSTIAFDVARNIEIYDLSLRAVDDGLRIPNFYMIPPDIRQMVLFDRAASAHELGGIQATDREGNVIADSRTLTPNKTNYVDRDFFKIHRDGMASLSNLTPTYNISQPEVTKQGAYILRVSRAMTDASGQFSGVVVGTLNLGYFHGLVNNVVVKEGDALSIVHAAGSIIMRAPFDIDVIGRNVRNADVFKRSSAVPSGSFEAVAGLDGVKRLYVFQNIPNTPLRISYGVSVDGIYANWRGYATWIGMVVLALCAVNMTTVIFLARSLKRKTEAEQTLHQLATTDGLTGLFNRRMFDITIAKEWPRSQRNESPISLLMIDADKFKNYNDQFGHQAGDTALTVIANCISTAARRSSDLTARYGGEEFIVLLPDTPIDVATKIAERIRASIHALRADQQHRADCTPTVSIGISAMTPRFGVEPRDLIKAADNALYQAKENGRDRCITAAAHASETLKRVA